MTIYCTICRRQQPVTFDLCGSCGTPVNQAEGPPPRDTTRCHKCYGGSIRVVPDGRKECGSCGHTTHGHAFRLPESSILRMSEATRPGARR